MYAIKMKDGKVFRTDLDSESLETLISGMRLGGVAHIHSPREFVISMDQVAWIESDDRHEVGE